MGAQATSAVNAMMDIYLIIASVGAGMGVACAVAISFQLGKDDADRAHVLASHAILLCFILAIIVGLLMFILIDPMVQIMEIQNLRELCMQYILPLIMCNVTLLINGAMCGILRAEGASVRVTIATLLNVTAAFFNPLFIIGFNMGVSGAAWGTIAGTLVSTAYLTYLFVSGSTTVRIDFKGFRFSRTAFKELLMINVPYSVQNGVRKFSNMIEKAIMMIVAGSILGGATIAVFSLPWSYIHMLECIGLAFGASMVPVVSFNIGRKNLENASTAFNYTLKTALMPTLVITGLIMLFAGPLISILTTDPSFAEYRRMMIDVLLIISFAAPIYPIRDISYNMLQTMRKNKLCMWVALLQVALKLVMMYIGGTLWGPTWMVVFNVVSNWIGGLIAFFLARYYWKHFYPQMLKITSFEEKLMDDLESMNEKRESSA